MTWSATLGATTLTRARLGATAPARLGATQLATRAGALRPHAAQLSEARPWSTVGLAIALGGLLLSIVGLAIALVLWAGQRFAPPPVSFMSGPLANATQFSMALAYAGMGALLGARQPRNPIGWLFLGIGVTVSFGLPTNFIVAAAQADYGGTSPAVLLAAWAASSFNLPLIGALAILVFLLFPNGRPLGRRWSIGGWLAVGGAGLVALGLALDCHGLVWYPSLPNPMASSSEAHLVLDGLQLVGLIAMLAALAVSSAAMVVRYRRATAAERAPLKLIAVAVLGVALTGGPFMIARYGLTVSPRTGEPLLVAAILAASLLPIAAGLGVLRYRLFDIDLILNHALVYVPLTGFLAGLYAASVALFQRIFMAVTGDTSDAAIVVTTLILASTFAPVRRALEGFVDRRFKPAGGAAGLAHAPSARDPEAIVVGLSEQLRTLEDRLARLERQGSAVAAEA